MKNGRIRQYQSKRAYQDSLKGMFAKNYQKKNHPNKIMRNRKRKIKHKGGVGKISSVRKKECEKCKREGLPMDEGVCKECAEAFASFEQPELPEKQKDLRIGVEERSHKIRAAMAEDNSNIGNIMNTDPQFRERINRQALEGMLQMNRAWVATVGREEAIRKFNEEAWGDAYFVIWGYQQGDNHAFIENRIGDRFVLLRNDRNDHAFRSFRNGDILEADLDAADQIYAFDYENRGYGVMFWDIQELRSQGRKVYEGRTLRIRPINIPDPDGGR
jgi:hypothetical protein